MPYFENNDARIYYEVHGEGFPILLLAPGGMRSTIDFWEEVSWNPINQLAAGYQVIAMDQRNAGQSTAPIHGTDGWINYTTDQLALLEHLGVDRFHIVGMCIGGSFIMGLIQVASERIASAVIFQPIGFDNNGDSFFDLFDDWAEEVKPNHPTVSDESWRTFRQTMFGGDFLFNVSEDFVANCSIPLLVLMGSDEYHPEVISRKLVELAPHATLIEHWKEPSHIESARAALDSFLSVHTARPGPPSS